MSRDHMPDRFEIGVQITPDDIDQLGHVNNVVYLRWVQDAAIAHWRATAPAVDQASLRWVVLRHEINYKRPAFLGDEITARTWVGVATRHAFERHTELLRKSDGRMLARARTLWCPIDAETGKTTDVSAEVRSLFSVSE
jgi:acyl-CoA thioester hydrolase